MNQVSLVHKKQQRHFSSCHFLCCVFWVTLRYQGKPSKHALENVVKVWPHLWILQKWTFFPMHKQMIKNMISNRFSNNCIPDGSICKSANILLASSGSSSCMLRSLLKVFKFSSSFFWVCDCVWLGSEEELLVVVVWLDRVLSSVVVGSVSESTNMYNKHTSIYIQR